MVTNDEIRDGRDFREEMLREHGEIYTSVWDIDFSKNSLMYDPRGRKANLNDKRIMEQGKFMNNSDMGNPFGMRERGVRGKQQAEAHSILPYDLVERLIRFYTKKGDYVLDPTMGDMAAMTVTHHLGRHFTGYDVSEKNFNFNVQARDILIGDSGQKVFGELPNITLHKQSSENIVELNNSQDFVFFSPPYWDLEYYGDEEEQLGYKQTYGEFLERLGVVIKECHRVLKDDCYIAININDFRKSGIFYDYHTQVRDLIVKAGFILHDIIIVNWQSCIGQCFARRVFDNKITAKKHEYIVVGKKIYTGEILTTEMDDSKLLQEEVVKEMVNEEKTLEVVEPEIPQAQIDMVMDEYDGIISKEKAIEIIKERGGLFGKD